MFQAQRMEALGQLTGGIAHDFNNLLMAIGGNLYLLTGRLPEDHPARRYANNASLATERGSRLTSQLLAFSRTQKMDIRPVELDPALSEARALLGSAMGPSIQVRLRLEAKGCWTLTDPDQLQLAILNLAVNARDAMPDGGSLTVVSGVRAAPSGNHGGGNDEGGKGEGGAGRDQAGYLSIQVRDTGEGMSREVAERAAEPFFTAKARGKGAGLGLAQVYGFVRQSQGDMRIESELGVGTTIELLLPRVTPPDAPPTPPVLAAAGVPGRPGGGRPILVIDDDDGVRAVLTEALGEAGFTVAEATSGEEGLRRLETIKPAAAIIDFIMPGMNGAEVARRAQAILPDLPIVFVSGYFDTVAVDGVNNAVVLRKPLDLTQLRTTVLSLVGWNSGNPPTPVSR
jgi:CheY-like chemotaxis protein